MNLDNRLRSAYRGQLEHAQREFGQPEPDLAELRARAAQASDDAEMGPVESGNTELGGDAATRGAFGFESSSRGWILAAAAVVLVVGGLVGVVLFGGDDAPPPQVVATEPGVSGNLADAPDNGTGDSADGGSDSEGGSESGEVLIDAVDSITPTPTATAAPNNGADDEASGDQRGERLPSAAVEPVDPQPTPDPAVAGSPVPVPTAQAGASGDADPATTPTASTVVPTPSATPTPPLNASATPTPLPTATLVPTPTATMTPVPTATPMPTPTATATPSPTPTATPTPTPIPYDPGVANSVCPSGARAQLELASLRYVSANQGWGRLYDLVDEQDGPFYFEAWEPGYADRVTVELVLSEPALATDIRVAQDPYTPTGGLIEIEAAGQSIGLALSGVDGWRVHTFGVPTPISQLTISRSQAESNIVELLICVAP